VANPNLRLVTPATENRTVTPKRAPNADLRTREHLTAEEVEKLIEAAKGNRHGYRDVGAGGLQNRIPAHPQGQERHSSNAPAEWP
jgi:hypothetical protein